LGLDVLAGLGGVGNKGGFKKGLVLADLENSFCWVLAVVTD